MRGRGSAASVRPGPIRRRRWPTASRRSLRVRPRRPQRRAGPVSDADGVLLGGRTGDRQAPRLACCWRHRGHPGWPKVSTPASPRALRRLPSATSVGAKAPPSSAWMRARGPAASEPRWRRSSTSLSEKGSAPPRAGGVPPSPACCADGHRGLACTLDRGLADRARGCSSRRPSAACPRQAHGRRRAGPAQGLGRRPRLALGGAAKRVGHVRAGPDGRAGPCQRCRLPAGPAGAHRPVVGFRAAGRPERRVGNGVRRHLPACDAWGNGGTGRTDGLGRRCSAGAPTNRAGATTGSHRRTPTARRGHCGWPASWGSRAENESTPPVPFSPVTSSAAAGSRPTANTTPFDASHAASRGRFVRRLAGRPRLRHRCRGTRSGGGGRRVSEWPASAAGQWQGYW